jgi:hypothetical protein
MVYAIPRATSSISDAATYSARLLLNICKALQLQMHLNNMQDLGLLDIYSCL